MPKGTMFTHVQAGNAAAARNAASHTRSHQRCQPARQISGAAAATHLTHNDARKRKRPFWRACHHARMQMQAAHAKHHAHTSQTST
jgi:hypothetical protein